MKNRKLSEKSSVDDIRDRFDADVERFSNLDTGQQATIDAPLAMELITHAALSATPDAEHILDIGCGAGNNSLKLLQLKNPLNVDLLDLSQPMLIRAAERISEVNSGRIRAYQPDLREVDLQPESYDIIIAAAVLHHLRDDRDWESAFRKIFDLTAPGGSIWITDLVSHHIPEVHTMMWKRYARYLEDLGGTEYRKEVFGYIDKEDSPRSVTYQLQLLREVGFRAVEILHKNSCFAAFGALK